MNSTDYERHGLIAHKKALLQSINVVMPTAPRDEGGRPALTTARDVIDWIAWMEHCAYVQSVCDSLDTAMGAFDVFGRSASAERGSRVDGANVLEPGDL